MEMRSINSGLVSKGIPWELIAGMRDKLIHEYDDVDMDEVWKTAEKDVPDFLHLLEPLLPQP